MATTHETPARLSMVGGMQYALKPHLTPESAWRLPYGMRFFQGEVRMVPRKVLYGQLTAAHAHPLLSLEAIPVGERGASLLVGLTQSGAWQVSADAPFALRNGDALASFEYIADRYTRWATTHYNRRVLFVNEFNPVRATDGSRIEELGTDVPRGRHIEMFFDHVVVGGPIWRGVDAPADIRWSHLYNFGQWEKGTDSEADNYTFAESLLVGGDGPLGVTGLRRIGETMFIYTATSISAMQYVGLPTVMRIVEGYVSDRGCGFQYGLAAAERVHYFPDRFSKTFYAFDGQSITDIGAPIRHYFWATLNADFGLQQRTYSYVDPTYSEIHWVYVSAASSGQYDLEVVYNYRDKTWTACPVENLHCFSPGARRARRIDEMTSERVDETSTRLEDASQAEELVPRVWGSAHGWVFREATADDAVANLVARPLPSLETGDFLYGSLHTMKDVSAITIHSKIGPETQGIQVEYTKERWLVDDPFTWHLAPELWTPSLGARRVSIPKTSSRVHRFRFTPKPVFTQEINQTALAPSFPSIEVAIPHAPPGDPDPEEPTAPSFATMRIVNLNGQQSPSTNQTIVPLQVYTQVGASGPIGWNVPHMGTLAVPDPLNSLLTLLQAEGVEDMVLYLNEVLNSASVTTGRVPGRLWTRLMALGLVPADATFVSLDGLQLVAYNATGSDYAHWASLSEPPVFYSLFHIEDSATWADDHGEADGSGYVMNLLVTYIPA